MDQACDCSDGIATITNRLDCLGHDIKKIKDNILAIQVGCEICEGMHQTKECPLKEEGKATKEVKYGEFGTPFQSYGENDARYHVGPPRYYIGMDNHPPYGEKKTSLDKTMNIYIEESMKKRAETNEWIKKHQEGTNIKVKNQDTTNNNLETQTGQLTKDFQTKITKEKGVHQALLLLHVVQEMEEVKEVKKESVPYDLLIVNPNYQALGKRWRKVLVFKHKRRV
uniref:Zinc knuckle CX2CX4HX4C n=1 Tax=Tanacetum cinerariifolium TaxID=118510 RepID=A0A6L2LP91_TANCI|nr:hypothetical protein [Tanacetum cinerariifolium]